MQPQPMSPLHLGLPITAMFDQGPEAKWLGNSIRKEEVRSIDAGLAKECMEMGAHESTILQVEAISDGRMARNAVDWLGILTIPFRFPASENSTFRCGGGLRGPL